MSDVEYKDTEPYGQPYSQTTAQMDHAAAIQPAGTTAIHTVPGPRAGGRVRKPYDYGGNPLARADTDNESARLPAFGGSFQPGTYRVIKNNNIANPAPLGLSAFALTTFVLSLINLNTRGVAEPNIVVASAYGYGGLVQLLAGMWEMAVGNTFGATALSSYGGFWISFAITLTPGGFAITEAYTATNSFTNAFGFYLMVRLPSVHPGSCICLPANASSSQGWFIFTFLMLICTLRSTVAFFFLFLTLDLAFLLLGIGYLQAVDNAPNTACIKAGGVFGILAAFAAWYNALAGILDRGNSFFLIPVAHFPWSVSLFPVPAPTAVMICFLLGDPADMPKQDKGRENRKKASGEIANNLEGDGFDA